MSGLWLVLRGLWFRRALSATLLAVAVVTVGSAALGPLYSRAAAESTLDDRLTGAGWQAGLHLSGTVDASRSGAVTAALAPIPAAGAVRGYRQRILGLRSGAEMDAGTGTGTDVLSTTVLWRQDACAHLVLVSGHCPSGPGEAIMSARTFAKDSLASRFLDGHVWHLGTRITAGPLVDNSGGPQDGGSLTLRIVGTYRPVDPQADYWFGRAYFQQHENVSHGNELPPTVDALLTTESTMLAAPEPSFEVLDADYPLTASLVRLDDEAAERRAVAAVAHRLATSSSPLRLVSSPVPTLDAADSERHLLEVATLLVTLQLVLLAWLVLFQVASDAIDARGGEIAMAKLRGFRPLAVVAFGLAEVLALLLLAVPLGLLAAWAATHAFAAGVFAPGTPVVTTVVPLAAAGVAFVGAAVACAVAGHATLTRPVLDQWRRTRRRPGRGIAALAADVVVSVAAVVALVLLLVHRHPRDGHGSAALLAPGLLVVAVALLGVRLLPTACRRAATATRASRRLGLFLASRQIARRPVGLRLASLLAIAIGLATFAVGGESVAAANRTARAEAELGADRVVSVQFDPDTDPVHAVDAADPDGRWAMAAAYWLPDGGDSVAGAVLAVDGSRLARVGLDTQGGPGAGRLAHEITGVPVPVISTRTTAIRVHLQVTGLRGDRPPLLRVQLSTPSDPLYSVYATTPIHSGAGTYLAHTSCTSGCTFRGLTWDRDVLAQTPASGTIALTGLDLANAGGGWSPVDLGTGVVHSWRAADPEGQAHDDVSLGAGRVVDHFTNENGGYGGIVYASNPSPIPAVATPKALVSAYFVPHPRQVIDSNGAVATFTVVSRVRVLPVTLDDGVVMDVRYLEAQLPLFTSDATWQVWLDGAAPPDALRRLERQGLVVTHVRTLAARETILSRQGTALAFLLLVACAVVGAVLAAGATAISISASGRRRTYEIAALRTVGVRRATLVRAAVLEHLLVLGAGVLLGVPAGVVAARLAMPSVPQFPDRTPVGLRYTPHLVPVVLFTAAAVALVVVISTVAGALLVRAALPSRLREAEG